jgi:hypothetical protein
MLCLMAMVLFINLGVSGGLISKYIKEKITEYILNKSNYAKITSESIYNTIVADGYEVLKTSFQLAHQSLREADIYDIKLSGTTCII